MIFSSEVAMSPDITQIIAKIANRKFKTIHFHPAGGRIIFCSSSEKLMRKAYGFLLGALEVIHLQSTGEYSQIVKAARDED